VGALYYPLSPWERVRVRGENATKNLPQFARFNRKLPNLIESC
jgi:hypothetical protein